MVLIMNELVRLTTQDVSRAIPVTDSIVIAERLDYEHYALMRLIRKHISDFQEFGAVDFESHLLNSKNVDVAILNENQFYLLITYLRTTKKQPLVLELKKELVRKFAMMKNELQARAETRHIGLYARKTLTDTIRDKVDKGTTFKSFAYSNYSKLVYKKVLNETVKSFKDRNHLTEKDNVRNYLTIEQLEKVQELESKIATYLEIRKDMGETDKQIYEEIKNHIK